MSRLGLEQVDLDSESQVERPGWSGARFKSGRRTALIRCPKCLKIGALSKHTISETGEIDPSLVCGYKCGFHEWVVLMGWRA